MSKSTVVNWAKLICAIVIVMLTIEVMKTFVHWQINGCKVDYQAPSFVPYRPKPALVWECRSYAQWPK